MSVLFGYLGGCATLVAIRLGWYALGLLEELLELDDEF